jgi:hypothetical protein
MNFSQLNQVFESDLPCAQRMLLVCLLDLMGKKGYSFPSQDTLAKMAGLAERSVRDHMAELIKIGAVSIVGHRGRCNVYSVTLSGLKPAKSAALNRQNLPDTDEANRQNLPPQPAKSAGVSGKICRLTNQEPLNEPLLDAAPSTKPRARKEKKESTADPRHKPFIEIWCATYERVWEAKYHFQSGKDGKALQTFLRNQKSMTADEWQEFISWIHQTKLTDGKYATGTIKAATGSLAIACNSYNQLITHA